MKRLLCLVFGFFLFCGCGQRIADQAQTQGLGATADGRNIAVLFGSPDWQEGNDDPDSTIHIPPGPGLPGVATDIREMTRLMQDGRNNFHFTAVSHDRAKVKDIVQMSHDSARDADSVLWFFTGHGGDGYLFAEHDGEDDDGSYKFSQVADAIKKARSGKPLKRLIVLIDACHSGEFVNGGQPIIDQQKWAEDFLYEPLMKAYDQQLYEQAFVMASSLTSETSIDLGAEKGGAFTYSLRMALSELRASNPRATFKDFAVLTTKKTQSVGGHTPVYKAFPVDRVINDTLFVY